MPILLSALIIAAPTYLYATLVRNIDRYEKEPVKYLLAAFLWGAVPAVILGIVLELVLAIPVVAIFGAETRATTFLNMGVLAPVVEETVKGLAVGMIFLWRRREFDGWIDGVVYGSTVGFGFAYVENIVYLYSAATPGEWFTLFFLRVIVLGFMHGFWTSLTGIGFGVARNLSSDLARAFVITLGLSGAILGHVLHNGSIALAEASEGASLCVSALSYLVLIVLMIGLGRMAGRRERAMMKAQLSDEVPHVIEDADYRALCAGNQARAWRGGMAHLACELAQKKQQVAIHGDGDSAIEIEALRARIRACWQSPATVLPVTLAPAPVAVPDPESPPA